MHHMPVHAHGTPHVTFAVDPNSCGAMKLGPLPAGWRELVCRSYEQVVEEINVQGPVARSVGRSVLLPKSSQFFVCIGRLSLKRTKRRCG